jgi:hypothetical protein
MADRTPQEKAPVCTSLVESLAAAYAEAVYRVLVADFPNLETPSLALLVREQVARQTEAPSPAFEVILDDPSVANWRLVPDPTGGTRWRVQVACCKPHPSRVDARREQRLNVVLRAIQPWKLL